MIALLPALSLSNKLIEVGALAAFAALVGIAILSLLVFSQARELKRLREWAGRAPERAAELEQRVAAEAAMRAQRPAQPVVPRATPMSRAGRRRATPPRRSPPPASPRRRYPGQPAPGQRRSRRKPAAAAPGAAGRSPLPTVAPLPTPVPGQPAFVPTAQTVAGAAQVEEPSRRRSQSPRQGANRGGGAASRCAARLGQAPKVAPAKPEPVARAERGRAARAARGQPLRAGVARGGAHAARGAPHSSRAVCSAGPADGRAALAHRHAQARSARASAAAPARPPLRRPARARELPDGPKFLVEEEPSSRKTVALIAGGVVVGVVVLAAILLSGGSGSNSPGTRYTAGQLDREWRRATGTSSWSSPAETHVIVLNATEADGLAHKLAGNLRQSGYGLALASSAKPPSARSTSVVEYASGHRTEAQHVGKTLGIGEVTPMEGAVASLVNGTSVVVIAGADKESLVGSSTEAAPTEAAPAKRKRAAGREKPRPARPRATKPPRMQASFLKLPSARPSHASGASRTYSTGACRAPRWRDCWRSRARTWTSSSWAGARRWSAPT